MRSDLGKGHTNLGPPVVVFDAPVPPPFLPALEIVNYRVPVDATADALQRRGPDSTLRPPAVVGAGIAFFGPKVWNREPRNNGENRQRRGFSSLGSPVVIGGAITYGGPGVRLTNPRDRVPPTTSRLSPPAVIFEVVVERYFGPKVVLAVLPSRHAAARRPLSGLAAPTVIAVTEALGGTLVASPRSVGGSPRASCERRR